MYKKKGETKYELIDQYIKNDPNSEKLKQYEEKLKNHEDKNIYEIYKIRFRERTSNGEIPSLSIIENRTQINKRRIIEYLDKILFSFQML